MRLDYGVCCEPDPHPSGNRADSTRPVGELLGQMLGARRSSVTVAAGTLQKAGVIRYGCGDLRIVDRKGLEEAACDCYPLTQHQIQLWRTNGE